MTHTPKNSECTFTKFTVNRGVEAREVTVGDTLPDTDTSSSSRAPTGSGALAARAAAAASGDAPASVISDDQSTSFVQVVVRKQHSGGGGCSDGPRLPTASSPAKLDTFPRTACEVDGIPPAVLLACPAFAALHQQSWDRVHSCGDVIIKPVERSERASGNGQQQKHIIQHNKKRVQKTKNAVWKNINNLTKQDLDLFEEGPERIEVFRFESGEYLSARGVGAGRVTRVERAAQRLCRAPVTLLREVLAVPRCLLAAPLYLLLHLERCVLECFRNGVSGVIQTASDLLLKPGLTLVFNAMLRPVLVCAAQTGGALRDAVRPLSATLGDAVEPLARLLASVRLVHIERRCTCTPV